MPADDAQNLDTAMPRDYRMDVTTEYLWERVHDLAHSPEQARDVIELHRRYNVVVARMKEMTDRLERDSNLRAAEISETLLSKISSQQGEKGPQNNIPSILPGPANGAEVLLPVAVNIQLRVAVKTEPL